MRRLRSVVVIALLWLAALAASSAPAEIHRPVAAGPVPASRPATPHGQTAERDGRGKRWALREAPAGKRWCAGGSPADA